MELPNPITSLAKAYYSAISKDFSDIEYNSALPNKPIKVKQRRPSEYHDITRVELFQMMFGSTSGLFGGIGGAAMTTVNIVIIECNYSEVCVYQNGSLVYKLYKPNEKFWDDVKNKSLKVGGAKIYKNNE